MKCNHIHDMTVDPLEGRSATLTEKLRMIKPVEKYFSKKDRDMMRLIIKTYYDCHVDLSISTPSILTRDFIRDGDYRKIVPSRIGREIEIIIGTIYNTFIFKTRYTSTTK